MDESGEQFVAYCLPTEDTIQKRRRDIAEGIPYMDGDTYEYKMAREYNWNVKSKASKGYEENYFLVRLCYIGQSLQLHFPGHWINISMNILYYIWSSLKSEQTKAIAMQNHDTQNMTPLIPLRLLQCVSYL